ncbi:MAG: 3-phosphoshikimate 1-carboxyvinyltransferase [Deltaproteobacteria bacterium]|nr:MAG: 3-phosphoshikimate 1-carboxyvinyltransferase [Deltaproteobacteria bacterium]
MIKEIAPCPRVEAAVYVPGSKSMTHRAIFMAALALGTTTLRGVLYSEDTTYTVDALKRLGINIWTEDNALKIKGAAGRPDPPRDRTEIYIGNSGTTARFLCSLAALSKKEVLITGDERLKKRPMKSLLRVLVENGVDIDFLEEEWHLPVLIKGPLVGGLFLLPEAHSSQFVSSLLIVGPCARSGMELAIKEPPFSKPYIRFTLEMMRRYGINYWASDDLRLFRIPPQPYRSRDITIEGDASSAAYFWAAAAATKGSMSIINIPSRSKQPDIGFLKVLKEMGCDIKHDRMGLTVKAETGLVGVDVDMNDMPDQVPTLAVLGLFAEGRTIIRNVEHLRGKESDRIQALVNEISKIGGKIKEIDNGLVVEGGNVDALHGAEIETYNDHRIAMSFAVAGLRVKGIKIKNPECVKKSYPDFWKDWERACYGKA